MANPPIYPVLMGRRAASGLLREDLKRGEGEDQEQKPAKSPYFIVLKCMMQKKQPEIQQVIRDVIANHDFSSAEVSSPLYLIAWHDALKSVKPTGTFLRNITEILGLQQQQMADFLDVTPKTLRNRNTAKRLPSADIEKLARVTRVLTAANMVFEDSEYAREWLEEPSEALGNRVPFDLLSSADGERLVMDELGRIEHGLPV